MFTPLTSSSSSSHPFVPYVDDPAKFLAMAQHELSFRYLQERFMSHVLPNMAPHNLFDHFPIVSPFIGANMGSNNTALLHTSNPYPASTKLSSLQGKKQISSLFQTGSSTIFPTYNQYGGHQLSIMSQSINNQQKELMGAFQVKNFSPNNHYYNPLTHLVNLPHVKDKERTKKSGKWSIAHVRIAWEIHLDQQRKAKDDKKEDVCNQSNAIASTNNDIWTSKKRKLKNDSQCVDVCDDEDDDIDPGKRMCVKQPLEQSPFLPSSIENNSRTDHSLTFHRPHQPHQSVNHQPHQSHQLINNQHSHSIHHMKKEREVLVGGSNRKSFIRKTGSHNNTCAGDTLINLLKITDVYTSLPGVVPTIYDQSTDYANLVPR